MAPQKKRSEARIKVVNEGCSGFIRSEERPPPQKKRHWWVFCVEKNIGFKSFSKKITNIKKTPKRVIGSLKLRLPASAKKPVR